jgi:hypothetical protein
MVSGHSSPHSNSLSDVLDIPCAKRLLPRSNQERRIQMDHHNERARIKRQTDPEWAKNHRDKNRSAIYRISKWREDNRQHLLEYSRTRWKEHYAQDPIAKLRRVVHYSTKDFAWFSESLPWKSHVPVRYEEKVQHKFAKCVLTKHGGFRLW